MLPMGIDMLEAFMPDNTIIVRYSDDQSLQELLDIVHALDVRPARLEVAAQSEMVFHDASGRPRLCQCAPQHGIAQHALRVVGQQDHVCREQRVGEVPEHAFRGGLIDWCGGLLIEPQQLVMTNHESRFCRSGSPRNDHKMWNDTAA